MASPQLLQLQDGADIELEYIAIIKERKIKNLAKDVSKVLKSLSDALNATKRKNKTEIDRQEESDSDRSSSWLTHCMDVADQVIKLYEQDAKNLSPDIKKREKLLRGVLQITDLACQLYLFEYLKWARILLDGLLLDDLENPFADELNRVKKYHEEVKEKKEEISRLLDEANAILDEIMESEEINKIKEKQFDNVVRLAHLEINSCRSRLAGAEEIIVKIDTILSAKRCVSRCVRFTGWAVSSYYFYQKYQASTIPFLGFVASSVVVGIAAWSLFPQKRYAFDKALLSNAALDHRELRRKLKDLFEEIECLKDNLTEEKQYHDFAEQLLVAQ